MIGIQIMAKTNQFTAAQFIEAIPTSGGLISLIAQRVGCSWGTAKKYVDTMPTIKAAYDNECAKVDDMAVQTVIESIRSGDVGTAKWWLAKKRKDEFGDTERHEITGANGRDLIPTTWAQFIKQDGSQKDDNADPGAGA